MCRSQSLPPSERANAQSGGSKSAAEPTAPQANANDDSYPRPLGVPGDVPRAQMAPAPRIPDSFPELLKFAAADSLSGHINNAAQIIALTRGLGSQLTAADLVAIRRRLLAALMVLEGVA